MIVNNIKTEAQIKSTDITDIRYFRNKFSLDGIIIDSPTIELLVENYTFLKENSVELDIKTAYVGRPDYLSYDIYGTTNLWFLLLYMNNCFNMEEFTMNKVIVPTKEAILHVLQNHIPDEIKEVK